MESLLVSCSRQPLSSLSSSVVKRRVKEQSNIGRGYHQIIKLGGRYTLVSHSTQGTPLLEAVAIELSLKDNYIVFYHNSNGLFACCVAGDFSVETRIESIEHSICRDLLAVIKAANGTVISVDSAVDVSIFDWTSGIATSSDSLLANKKLRLVDSKHLRIPITLKQKAAFVMVVMFLVSSAVYLFLGEKEKNERKEVETSAMAFDRALTTRGSVKAFTWQLYRDLVFTRKLVGWKASRIDVDGETAVITVQRSDIGRIDDLVQLVADTNRMIGDYGAAQASIVSQYKSVPALNEAVLVPIEGLKLYFSEAQDDWLQSPNTQISFDPAINNGGYSTVGFSWKFETYYEDDFDVMGTILNMVPVVFDKASITVSDDGSLSGLVHFTLFGCLNSECSK